MSCSIEIARNLAFYGNPTGDGDTRVPSWANASQLEISTDPELPSNAEFITITAVGEFAYNASPFYRSMYEEIFGIDYDDEPIVLSYTHQQRYIGW